MKQAIFSVVALLGLCLLASTAIASDLTLNGETSVDLPPGASLHVELTGSPGLVGVIMVDIDNGPVLLKGESFPLGVTPLFNIVSMDTTDGTGLLEFSAVMPGDTMWLGLDIYVAGVILDPADSNGLDISNGTDLLGIPETCTPAVIAACLAAGLTACTSGTPDCGPPPPDLCTPAVLAACDASGFCDCDPLTGACFDMLDSCGICGGNGTGGGCGTGTICGGSGTCVCGECDCPPPDFGATCGCIEYKAHYNGLFQHSYIEPTPDTVMGPGNPLSFEGWFKPTRMGNALATRMGSSGIIWGLSLGVPGFGSANKVNLYNTGVCGNCFLTGNAIIPLDEWVHIALTWDDTTNIASIYINGVLDVSGPFVAQAPSSGQLLIGLQGAHYYEGDMDELRMWRTVRTPTEILNNYDKSLNGVGEPDLVFNHNMQKWRAAEAECVDFSDSGNNLINSNFGISIKAPNAAPAPLPVTDDNCPDDCSNAGLCSCGICTCFIATDTSYDCSISGGGG